MQGRVRTLTTFKTGDPVHDRFQEHVRQTVQPALDNPVLNAADFRWAEVQGTDPSKTPTFVLQYRSTGDTWTTVLTVDSAGQIVAPLKGESDNASATPSIAGITSASGWTDIPGTSASFTVRSAVRRTKAVLTFAGFATVVAGSLSVRLVADGVQIGSTYNLFYNTLAQHQSWSFQWPLAAGAVGAIGTLHTVKAQIQVNTATTAFTMNSDDATSLIVEEMA